MLTDEELSTRLSTAFHESIPDLTYAGAVPQVRTARHRTRRDVRAGRGGRAGIDAGRVAAG